MNSFDLEDYTEIIKNGIIRYKNKIFPPEEGTDELELPEYTNSEFPPSVIGKKTKIFGDRRYTASESILLNGHKFGFRNRKDYTPIQTSGGIITTFHSIVPYSERKQKWESLIGITSDGIFKCGHNSEFSDGDFVTLSYCNRVKDFAIDKTNKVICDKINSLPACNTGKPRFILLDGTEGHLNIFMRINDCNGSKKVGVVSGGKVIIKCEDEIRLASGSIHTIYNVFKDMKERHKAEYCDLYIIDNGTFNIGIRTYDDLLTTIDLKQYDRQNISGGHFFYIKKD